MRRFPLPMAIATIALAVSLAASASPGRTSLDDREFVRLSSMHPAARDLLEKGEALAAGGDREGALAAFQQAEAEAPESGLVYRRACETLTVLGRRAEAIA